MLSLSSVAGKVNLGVLEQEGIPVIMHQQPIEEDGEEVVVWGIKHLIKQFHELRKNKALSSKTGFIKAAKAQELKKKIDTELTFTPAINEVSKVLGKSHDAKLKKSLTIDSRNKVEDRINLLYHQQNIKEMKLEERKRQRDAEKLKECTFQPNLQKTKKFNDMKQSKTLSKSISSEVVDRLYRTQQEKYDILEKIKEDKMKRSELQELAHCTFFPQTNDVNRVEDLKKMYDQADLPRSYYETIDRLRIARDKHMLKKHMLEHIPTGEGYERRRNIPFNPPSCADGGKSFKSRVPFITFDVNIGAGKTGRLAICDGDDPADKARSFAAAFQLKPEVEESLKNLIQANLDEYYNQLT